MKTQFDNWHQVKVAENSVDKESLLSLIPTFGCFCSRTETSEKWKCDSVRSESLDCSGRLLAIPVSSVERVWV